jgi:hypothetical protein
VAKTPVRAVRVDDELWARAWLAAEENGTNVSAVVRAALERYARRYERQIEEAGK